MSLLLLQLHLERKLGDRKVFITREFELLQRLEGEVLVGLIENIMMVSCWRRHFNNRFLYATLYECSQPRA